MPSAADCPGGEVASFHLVPSLEHSEPAEPSLEALAGERQLTFGAGPALAPIDPDPANQLQLDVCLVEGQEARLLAASYLDFGRYFRVKGGGATVARGLSAALTGEYAGLDVRLGWEMMNPEQGEFYLIRGVQHEGEDGFLIAGPGERKNDLDVPLDTRVMAGLLAPGPATFADRGACGSGETESQGEARIGTARVKLTYCAYPTDDRSVGRRIREAQIIDGNDALKEPVDRKLTTTAELEGDAPVLRYKWTPKNVGDSITVTLDQASYELAHAPTPQEPNRTTWTVKYGSQAPQTGVVLCSNVLHCEPD
jgi:hypothetical protein